MASTKTTAATMVNPSAIHHSSPPSFATPRLLSAIPSLSPLPPAPYGDPSPSPSSPTPPLPPLPPLPPPPPLPLPPLIEVFAYPGGAFMEIHEALTRSPSITNHLLRHEQGELFAVSGYARSTGCPNIYIATSSPGTTNLVSSLADALLDSVPMVAITGQVPRRVIITDAFQETPIIEVTRSITKHNYLVLVLDDILHIVKEAFFLASSCHSCPMLVDIPKDI